MKKNAFTLIELLVVIAILLILIAIALPKYLDSQVRARVTKVQSELRTVGFALENYRLDWRIYPSRSVQYYKNKSREEIGLTWLLDPVPYFTHLPDDPFPTGIDHTRGVPGSGPASYILTGVDVIPSETSLAHPHGGLFLRTWLLYSAGPDAPDIEVPHTLRYLTRSTRVNKGDGATHRTGYDYDRDERRRHLRRRRRLGHRPALRTPLGAARRIPPRRSHSTPPSGPCLRLRPARAQASCRRWRPACASGTRSGPPY